jgi:CBS domain-containing protein
MQASVSSIMSRDLVSIGPEASALEAFERMLDHGIRHLPVVDRDARVVGVLSIDDLRAAFPFETALARPLTLAERRVALEWRIGEIMSFDPDTLDADATVADAAARMADRRIGCLPILDDGGRLVGLVSETDVLWAVAGRPQRKRVGRDQSLRDLVGELERERVRVQARLKERLAAEQSLDAVTREEPLDEAERGSNATILGEAIALDELAVRRLAALEAALDRAAHGRFGLCEKCGEPIAIPRLRALPSATTCIGCAYAAGE